VPQTPPAKPQISSSGESRHLLLIKRPPRTAPTSAQNVSIHRARRELSILSVAILVAGSILFYLLAKSGGRILDDLERQEKAALEHAGDEKLEQGVANPPEDLAPNFALAPNANLANVQ